MITDTQARLAAIFERDSARATARAIRPGDKVTIGNGKRVWTVLYQYSAVTTALRTASGNPKNVATSTLRKVPR